MNNDILGGLREKLERLGHGTFREISHPLVTEVNLMAIALVKFDLRLKYC